MTEPNAEYEEISGGSLVHPVVNPNKEDVRSIPIGSEVIVVNYQGAAPTIGSVDWTRDTTALALTQLNDEEDRFDGSIFLVLKPIIVPEHSDSVLSPDEVIDQVVNDYLGENYSDEARDLMTDDPAMSVTEALIVAAYEDGNTSRDTVIHLLKNAVAKAREGLVENPF